MPYDEITRAVTMLVAFTAQLAGHYLGDHWFQTDAQACKKSLDSDATTWSSIGHCAQHVVMWTLTTMVFFTATAWWLGLPLRPGWVAAGVAVNMVTHFVADLRTPLMWMARKLGRQDYMDNVKVVRPGKVDPYGPGTATFHLDQSWHIGWLLVSACLMAGPPALG